MPVDLDALPDLQNPMTGDRLWFETVPTRENDRLVFRCEIPAHSPGTPMHFHTKTDEVFEAVRGELAMCVDRSHKEIRLPPGEKIEIPRMRPHRFYNASGSPVVFRSSATPGIEFCRFIESIYGLAADGLVGKDGMPRNLLRLAVIRELSDLYFPGVPLLIQRPGFGLLSVLASATGVARSMQRYWTRANPSIDLERKTP